MNRIIYSFGLHKLCAKIEFPFWMFDWSCTQMIEAVYGAFISCRWVQAYKPGEWNPSRSWQQSKLKKCLWHICYVIISTDGHRSRLGIPDMITWYNMVFETWLPRELVSHLFYSHLKFLLNQWRIFVTFYHVIIDGIMHAAFLL